MSPSTQHGKRVRVSQTEDTSVEVTTGAGFTRLIEVLSHPRFQEYVYDELTVRVLASLAEAGLDDDRSVQTYIGQIAYGYGEHPKAINLLKMWTVRRCFLELVFDHGLPHYDRLAAQNTRWYCEMLEHRLTRQNDRAGRH